MSETKKTHSLHIRFSEAEYTALKNSADAASMSIAEYVRTTSVKNQKVPEVHIVKITPSADFDKTLREVSAVGSNINQIARSLHRYGDFDGKALMKELKKASQKIDALEEIILEIKGQIK